MYLLVFIIGLVLGSFLNVVIYREAMEDEGVSSLVPPWLTGRSVCEHCGKKISWYDNIPLLSFILLKGRCRYCSKKISFMHPVVELLVGVEFVWLFYLWNRLSSLFSGFEGLYSIGVLVVWLLIALFFLGVLIADFKYMIIPDGVLMVGIIGALLKLYVDYRFRGMVNFSVLPSSAGAFLLFLLIFLVTRGKGMGFGDVKLALVLGLILGYPLVVVAIYFAFLVGGFVGILLLIFKRKKMKSKVAFGPFLIIGSLVALLYGERIVEWYSMFF